MSANFTASSYCLDTLSYKTKSHGPIMPSGHYKKVIDPRTRAEVAPEVVPFWHVKLPTGTGEFNISGKYSDPTIEQTLEAKSSLPTQDAICSFFSLAAFFLTFSASKTSQKWQLWGEHVLCYPYNSTYTEIDFTSGSCTGEEYKQFQHHPALAMQYAYNSTNYAVEQYCNDADQIWGLPKVQYSLPEVPRRWNETNFNCMITTYDAGGFWIWHALRFIFAISFLFQFARFSMAPNKDNSILYWGLNKIFADYYKILLEYFGVTEYKPYQPDFWRWYEYALTSGIQVAIIGLSFFIGNVSELLALSTLQSALCFMGFIIEKRIDKIYKARIDDRDQAIKYKKKTKIFIVLGSAWTFFAIIWYVLINRFIIQSKNPSNCAFGEDFPNAIYFIVIAECILFGLFGCWQTLQVICCFTWGVPNKAQEVTLKQKRIETWIFYTRGYTWLSLISKTILEIGLLWFALSFDEMIQHK